MSVTLLLGAATVVGLTAVIAFIVNRWVVQDLVAQGVRKAWRGWREYPGEMAIKLVLALVLGQCVFWLLGYDQLGFFMSPKWEFGQGHSIAEHVANWLPASMPVVALVKAIEICTDAARIYIEGKVYIRRGFVPDFVATLCTSPLWQCFEVAEKVSGVLLHAERLNTRDQMIVSLACIYGNLFRYGLDALIWFKGDAIYNGVRNFPGRLTGSRSK